MTYKGVEIGNSPTLAMIEEYIAVKGFDVDAREVYEEYSRRDWKTLKHQPLKSVEAMVNAANGAVIYHKIKKGIIPPRQEEQKKVIIVHTYGRYNEETNIGRWGYQIKFIDGSEKIERGTDVNAYTTANRMELTAISKALNNFGLYSRFEIIVESDYAKHVIDHNDNAIFYPQNQDIIKDIYSKLNGSAMMYTVKVNK